MHVIHKHAKACTRLQNRVSPITKQLWSQQTSFSKGRHCPVLQCTDSWCTRIKAKFVITRGLTITHVWRLDLLVRAMVLRIATFLDAQTREWPLKGCDVYFRTTLQSYTIFIPNNLSNMDKLLWNNVYLQFQRESGVHVLPVLRSYSLCGMDCMRA